MSIEPKRTDESRVRSSVGLGRELRYISETPELLSLLYDLDLLPEQLEFGTRDWGRMLQLTAWHISIRNSRPNSVLDRTPAKPSDATPDD